MYNLYMGFICNVLRISKIVCMKDSEIKWVLTLSEEDKIMFLEDMLKEQKYGMAFEFMGRTPKSTNKRRWCKYRFDK